jgi:hypothetical protein
MPSDIALEPAGYRLVVDELITLSRERPRIEVRSNPRRVLVLAGLELEVVDTSAAALMLMDGGRHHAAEPLTRKAFEFAVVAQWIHMMDETGVDAYFDVHDIRESQMAEQASKAGFEFPEDLRVPRPASSPESATLKWFEQVCDALQGGKGLYFLYRAFSSGCHPTGSALARWLGPDENPTGLRFINPDERPDKAQLYALAASLIWVGRAVDLGTKFRPRQDALKKAALRIGIPSVLKRAG